MYEKSLIALILILFCSLIGSLGEISPTITHGMIIDASSFGSSINVFTWPARLFDKLPTSLTLPFESKRLDPGITPALYTYADHPQDVWEHLDPLIEYAKDKLVADHDHYSQYPIFLKATAGIRTLTQAKRTALMEAIRDYMFDESKNPFYFEWDFARVISGEEEAAYGWTSVNFLGGILAMNEVGFGPVDADKTYGSLDLGGDSASIAFYIEEQDILNNLFKLQFADSKHWNVYVHSHIWYGVNTAHERLRWNLVASYNAGYSLNVMGMLPESMARSEAPGTQIEDPCFPPDYRMDYMVRDTMYYITGPSQGANWTACREQSVHLLNRPLNTPCLEENREECSFCGTYQPLLPEESSSHGHFFGFEAYADLWEILELPKTATLTELETKGARICSLSFAELQMVQHNVSEESGTSKWAPQQYCFLASYALTLLHEGYGFGMERSITCQETMNNEHVGWVLGAMIYEINSLPWIYTGEQRWIQYALLFTILAGILTLFLFNSLLAIFSAGTRVRAMTDDPISEILRSSKSLERLHISGVSLNKYASVQEALHERQ
mmetsp:Transcript_30107/g.39646  ORF Transcript_30107/g.39646 Transcript_30107/m.39646 type:complete len:555 (-) Transcript_30107:173-1837(-)